MKQPCRAVHRRCIVAGVPLFSRHVRKPDFSWREHYAGLRDHWLRLRLGPPRGGRCQPAEHRQNLHRDLIDSILNDTPVPIPPIVGYRSLQVVDAVFTSIREHRAVEIAEIAIPSKVFGP